MSANSKRARKLRVAKEFSASRKNGNPGPKKTTPRHGKQKAWYQLGKTNNKSAKKQTAEEQQ